MHVKSEKSKRLNLSSNLFFAAILSLTVSGCATFFTAEEEKPKSPEKVEKPKVEVKKPEKPVPTKKVVKVDIDTMPPLLYDGKAPPKPVFPKTPAKKPLAAKNAKPNEKTVAKNASATKKSDENSDNAVNKLIAPSFKTSPFLNHSSFVTKWDLLGPFKFDPSKSKTEEKQELIHHAFMTNENILNKHQSLPSGVTWKLVEFKDGKQTGQIGLSELYSDSDYCVAYAMTQLKSPTLMEDVSLYVGSNDYLKIWLNGKLVHTYNRFARDSDWDQDVVQGLTLKMGLNQVVVKALNVTGIWDFYFRLTNKDGMPICVE